MILTRLQGFKRAPSLLAMALVAMLLAAPAWAQEKSADAPTAAGQEAEQPGLFWMPDAISTYGEGVDDLFVLIFWITGIAFVVVEGLMLWFLFRYRNREGREKAHYTHGNNKLEVTWTLATVVILVFIGVVQLVGDSGWLTIKTGYPEKDGVVQPGTFVVRVYGEQFAWHFNYPGKDGKFEDQRHSFKSPTNPIGLDDPAKDKVLPKLVVPENVNILIELNALGKYDANTETYTHPVLHSFFSPNLRLKQDLVPYHPGKIWFKIKQGTAKEGKKYEIVCAELCGEGHSNMHAPFLVLSEEDLAKELGYDWKTAVPAKFPEPVHYHQEQKEAE
ncbi:MAG: cytochrome c oxidase subunit II [Planctomycetota bacterium]|nr:cytochrome c oxidase subunit II [Planctomycetota bacterium]